jgi:hypothetical protein
MEEMEMVEMGLGVMVQVVMDQEAQEMEVMATGLIMVMAIMVARQDLGQKINIQIQEIIKHTLISLHRLHK